MRNFIWSENPSIMSKPEKTEVIDDAWFEAWRAEEKEYYANLYKRLDRLEAIVLSMEDEIVA